MKILFLTPFLPYTSQEGNKIRPFNWIKHLSKKNEIYLVSLIESAKENEYLNELRKYCSKVVAVLRRPKSGFKYRIINLFQNSPYFIVKQFESSEMQEKINLILKENKFDLVHVSTLAMTQYIDDIKGIPKILDAVDCNKRNYFQQWQSAKGLRNRILSFIDWYKIRSYECKMYSKFNKCLLASPVDKKFMEKLHADLPIEVIPNGVDLEYFKPQITEEEFPSLVFTGFMNYIPNEDAMIYFCSKILPLVEETYSQIKCYIVGKGVSDKLRKAVANKKNVMLTGFVEDVKTFINKASIFICPLRMGTGIKNKVLEAMAMRKPVISSSFGAESINVVPGKDIMIADKPEEFAKHIIELLKDKNKRFEIGTNARRLVENNHDWSFLGKAMDKIYKEAVDD